MTVDLNFKNSWLLISVMTMVIGIPWWVLTTGRAWTTLTAVHLGGNMLARILRNRLWWWDISDFLHWKDQSERSQKAYLERYCIELLFDRISIIFCLTVYGAFINILLHDSFMSGQDSTRINSIRWYHGHWFYPCKIHEWFILVLNSF